MTCINSALNKIFQTIKRLYLKWYWYIFGVLFFAFWINFFGGIIYGATNKPLVKQRINHLEQITLCLGKDFRKTPPVFSNVKKLPAIFVNAYFNDIDSEFSFRDFLFKAQMQGWEVYSFDEKNKKAMLYNEDFIAECKFSSNKNQVVISITFNEIWTRIEWPSYHFVPYHVGCDDD